MRITPVPCLSDNYAYVCQDSQGRAFVVDPVEPPKVLDAAETLKVKVAALLTTHHHADHSGGNAAFAKAIPNIPVYGYDSRIPALTTPVQDGDVFSIGALEVKSLFTPCHTTGSVCYYVQDKETGERAVFTGDTLFIGGCGRFFEGTAEQMQRSLNVVLASLPDDTAVYCGHEYTKSNLKFAAHVDPTNPAVRAKAEWCENKHSTVPSSIGEEKTFNPFMRVGSEAIKKQLGLSDGASEVEVMGALRSAKDKFRG
ncbi:hypothetical protein HDU86_006574 [Geranomyces michiganensis]|nr:hypothetical protein HDU86_006574 [Geranomyces michiganensis]